MATMGDELTGQLAKKLVNRCTDAEAKDILLAACDSGDVYQAIHLTLERPSLKKPRKSRTKKQTGGSPERAQNESHELTRKKSLMTKCLEYKANYPAIWEAVVASLGEPYNDETRKQAIAEFKRLHKEKKN